MNDIRKDIGKAIKNINNFIEVWELEQADEYIEVIISKDDIKAFKTAISALEKQIPKKPQEVDVDFSTFVCPNCLSAIMYTDEKETHNYCLNCGQKLDWRLYK